MVNNKAKIDQMISDLNEICATAEELENKYAYEISKVHPKFKKSALNLLHYLALRNHDIRDLQNNLEKLCVSRLGRAESHVMASIITIKNMLKGLNRYRKDPVDKVPVEIEESSKIINSNTNALLGKKLKGSRVRIMVTQPSEAVNDKKLVYNLLSAGMNCARINCAHDDKVAWKKMIANINKAKSKTGRNCKICMDLGGPKLRTGMMKPGPKVIHLNPTRDAIGNIVAPANVFFHSEEIKVPLDNCVHIPVKSSWLKKLRKNDVLRFKDARGKKCKLIVGRKFNNGRWAICYDSAYVITGTKLVNYSKKKKAKSNTTIGELLPIEQKIILNIGDMLRLHKDPIPGEPAQYNNEGKLINAAHISCTLPQVFEDVRVGECVLLDDGKIEGKVKSVTEKEIYLEITYAKENGGKLKADKGINFPESKIRVSGLTDKDKQDLKFVVQNADVVNLSFVNNPSDVFDLLSELKTLETKNIGIILKIETINGFNNLPAILLAAMQVYPLGVMIARGDLAIEGGWQNLAGMQEELMSLCAAAHIPIVWATQVLESLSKKGIPSRAEITDAAMAQQAECVMLNKGPHIVQAIKLLDTIMKSMEDYHRKKAPLLPALKMINYVNLPEK